MMAPILKQVKDTLKDEVTIIKVDVDKNPKMAQAYQIQGVPTLMIFKEGNTLWRQSGVVAAKQLEQILQSHM
jgi:thioredoxin 1